MRLIDESVMEGGHLTVEERIALQAEEIKQLWQENEQLKAKLDDWKYEAKCHMDEVIAREKQIEQLRAQVARMREALECVESDFVDGVGIVACAFCGKENAKERGHQEFCVVGKALISIDTTDYHNPADVEALRKARNLLQRYKDHIKSYPCECKFGLDFYGNKTPFRDGEMCERCAELAAIDKAIGGKEE